MNWLYYLAEANLYLAAFYLCYVLLLKRETHYTMNRAFLLLSCVAALLLPLIQLGFLKPAPVLVSGTITLAPAETGFTWQDGLVYSYFTGVLILSVQFAFKLFQLQKLMRKPGVTANGYKLIYLEDLNTAFSFFNYLFISRQTAQPHLITRHELVHIKQKHSADIIFIEVFKIVNWFNPLVYLLQNSLKTLHEYIADEQTARYDIDPVAYSAFLVSNAYGVTGSSVTHSFYNYNLLKNRIMMLNQKRSGNLARLKYLLALPLSGAMLCQSTLGFSKTYGFIDIAPNGAARAAVQQDTVKKHAKKVTPVASTPRKESEIPAPKIEVVRYPAPPPPPKTPRIAAPKIEQVKFAAPKQAPGNQAPKIQVVKFAPPKAKVKEVKITEVKLAPPPTPPLQPRSNKTAPVQEIRIEEPAAKTTPPIQEVRIQEPAAGSTAPVQQIRIEPIKKS